MGMNAAQSRGFPPPGVAGAADAVGVTPSAGPTPGSGIAAAQLAPPPPPKSPVMSAINVPISRQIQPLARPRLSVPNDYASGARATYTNMRGGRFGGFNGY